MHLGLPCSTASEAREKCAALATECKSGCCAQAALLAGGRGNARASMRPGSGASPCMSGLPRHSAPKSSTLGWIAMECECQTSGRCMQAALLASGRGNTRASMRPGSGPSPRMSGLPRHSVPSMRKEVVLATKAELADRKPSREEPLSTFDLEKLKAFSRGWTPDRGRGKDHGAWAKSFARVSLATSARSIRDADLTQAVSSRCPC